MFKVLGYGRLGYTLAITLPPAPKFGVTQPQFHILAHTIEAKDAIGNASTELVSYSALGRSFVLDIVSVLHIVGRAETQGVKAGGEWAIIDCSEPLCSTFFHQEEEGFEEEKVD